MRSAARAFAALCRLALATVAVAAQTCSLPSSLRRVRAVVRKPAVWQALCHFFSPGGPATSWRVAVDTSCIIGGKAALSHRSLSRTRMQAEMLDAKW